MLFIPRLSLIKPQNYGCTIDKILLPYVNKQRKKLKLENSHPALLLFDCFRGQTTADVQSLLLKSNFRTVLIPPNCTDKLQPMDVSINKPMKDKLRSQFQAWYSSEVEAQLKDTTIDQVKVDVSMSYIKGRSANWIIGAWQEISRRPDTAINGFRHTGIVKAVSDVRS